MENMSKIIDFSKKRGSRRWNNYSFEELFEVWKASYEKDLIEKFIKINKLSALCDLSICSSATEIDDWYKIIDHKILVRENDILYLSPWSKEILLFVENTATNTTINTETFALWYPVYNITKNKNGYVNVSSFLYSETVVEII